MSDITIPADVQRRLAEREPMVIEPDMPAAVKGMIDAANQRMREREAAAEP